MSMNKTCVLVLTGPTGSGKSACALDLARQLDGEIISADSMQVYRHMTVGTAKLAPEDQQGIPHFLIDYCDPDESFTLADFLQQARILISEIGERNHTPIICGGTGLYIKTLVDGIQLSESNLDPTLRQRWQDQIDQMGLDAAHEKMMALDPISASRIHPGDRKRIVRFFELYEQTGLTRTQLDEASRKGDKDWDFCCVALYPDRTWLYQQINRRTAELFRQGLLEETSFLIEKYPGIQNSQAFQAIGYKEIIPLLDGEISEEEALERLSQSTRRYAKRQLSLIRSRQDFHLITDLDPKERVTHILEYWNQYCNSRDEKIRFCRHLYEN